MFSSRSNSGRRLGGPGGAFGRAGEDSGTSSRTGTPPTRDRDSVAHANAFGYAFSPPTSPTNKPTKQASVLDDDDDDDADTRRRLLADAGDHPGSPPSTHASPALSKATLDKTAAGDEKKD